MERIEWDWGDGTLDDDLLFPASHTYAPNGAVATVTVTAYDSDGGSSTEVGTVDLSGCLLGPPPNQDLSGMTVTTTETYEACNSITASDFSIVAPGNATFRAGTGITLGEGFVVEAGCEFAAMIETPAGCP